MKRLIGSIVAMLIASGVFAAPIVWTVPSTLLSGGTTISGTFIFDTATNTLSNVNIITTGAIPGTFSFLGAPNATFVFGQQAASISNGNTGVFVNITGLPGAGGPYNSTFLGTLSCNVAGGLCNGGLVTASVNDVTLTGAAPVAANVPVPTLSEYAMLILASLIAMFGAWQLRRRGVI